MSGESMDTSEKTYGGCEGPDAMYVKLISSDGNFSKLITRSAHRTPNLTNPEFFVCLLFDYLSDKNFKLVSKYTQYNSY